MISPRSFNIDDGVEIRQLNKFHVFRGRGSCSMLGVGVVLCNDWMSCICSIWFQLFLEPFHDVQLIFVVAPLRIYQNHFDGTSKSLSFAHHILLAMIIHNQQGRNHLC